MSDSSLQGQSYDRHYREVCDIFFWEYLEYCSINSSLSFHLHILIQIRLHLPQPLSTFPRSLALALTPVLSLSRSKTIIINVVHSGYVC